MNKIRNLFSQKKEIINIDIFDNQKKEYIEKINNKIFINHLNDEKTKNEFDRIITFNYNKKENDKKTVIYNIKNINIIFDYLFNLFLKNNRKFTNEYLLNFINKKENLITGIGITDMHYIPPPKYISNFKISKIDKFEEIYNLYIHFDKNNNIIKSIYRYILPFKLNKNTFKNTILYNIPIFIKYTEEFSQIIKLNVILILENDNLYNKINNFYTLSLKDESNNNITNNQYTNMMYNITLILIMITLQNNNNNKEDKQMIQNFSNIEEEKIKKEEIITIIKKNFDEKKEKRIKEEELLKKEQFNKLIKKQQEQKEEQEKHEEQIIKDIINTKFSNLIIKKINNNINSIDDLKLKITLYLNNTNYYNEHITPKINEINNKEYDYDYFIFINNINDILYLTNISYNELSDINISNIYYEIKQFTYNTKIFYVIYNKNFYNQILKENFEIRNNDNKKITINNVDIVKLVILLINANKITLGGKKLINDNKEKLYQIYVHPIDNKYFINYERKKIYLNKNNIRKMNNKLYLKINKNKFVLIFK